MIRVFFGLVISYVLVMTTAFVFGLMVRDDRSFAMHFGLGLFGALYTLLVYCVVLTYFVITGKIIKQAVIRGGLAAEYIHRSQRPKASVIRWTVLAVGTSLGGILLGAWAGTQDPSAATSRAALHLVGMCAALVCNFAAFWMLYHHIHRNAALVDAVCRELDARRAERSTELTPV